MSFLTRFKEEAVKAVIVQRPFRGPGSELPPWQIAIAGIIVVLFLTTVYVLAVIFEGRQ